MRPKTPHLFVVEDRGYSTPCHVWTRATNSGGYGVVRVGKAVRGAHVLAYEAEYGPVPDGHEIDHLCRVRACVNAAHLEPVTKPENLRRGAKTKLTATDVAEIRAARAAGVPAAELAVRFGVTKSWIWRIGTGRSANRSGEVTAWAA